MLPFLFKTPIAMLHAVNDSAEPSLADWRISRKAFTQLLDVLEEEGFATTHFAALSQNGEPSPRQRRIILSFDDCAKHLLDFAVPELLRRGMRAVFYMPTAYTGGYNAWDAGRGESRLELMNENDLRDLVRLGMEVGSHSHSHCRLGELKDASALAFELSHSKTLLETITGERVYSFAYPYGSVPAGYGTVLREAGYAYAVCIYHRLETRFALRRFGVYQKDTPSSLRRKLSARYRWLRALYDAVKTN